MPDTTAALAAIDEAHGARAEAWSALSAAGRWIICDPPRLGIARANLRDALDACDRMRAAIVTAQAEVGKLTEAPQCQA